MIVSEEDSVSEELGAWLIVWERIWVWYVYFYGFDLFSLEFSLTVRLPPWRSVGWILSAVITRYWFGVECETACSLVHLYMLFLRKLSPVSVMRGSAQQI